MKHWWYELLAFLGERLRAEDGRERVLLGGSPAFAGRPHTRPEEPRMQDAGEFEDLLQSLGAIDGPRELEAQVLFKELEIAELQRNLKDLRGMGDALADIEQERLAERDELVGQRVRAQEEGALWKARSEELQRQLDELQCALAVAGERPVVADGETEALARRHAALRARHARLTARWRGLPRGERKAADEVLTLRAQLVETRRESARLAARGERLERELERREVQRERDRERATRTRARLDEAREKAREGRERAKARGAEVRELREVLRARDERLGALEGLCAALRETLDVGGGEGDVRRQLEELLARLT